MADKKKRVLKEDPLETGKDGGMSNEALLKLVNILGDTDYTKLTQLTKIGAREVFPLSVQITMEQIDSAERIKNKIPLSRVWREAYFQLKRSVDRWYFMILAGLAHEQAQAETEKGEEEEW